MGNKNDKFPPFSSFPLWHSSQYWQSSGLGKLPEYAKLARRLERERNILSYRIKTGQEELLNMLVHFRIKIETINNN